MCSLNELLPNQSAVIEEISVGSGIGRRLFDMGLVRGTQVMCVLESPQKDPKAFLVRGSVLALRNEESKKSKFRERSEQNAQR